MILSKNNEKIKSLKKSIDNNNIVFLDTENLIMEAVQSSWDIECVLYEENKDISFLNHYDCEKIVVSPSVLSFLTNIVSTTGVAVAVKIKSGLPQKPIGNFVVLNNVQDPGNVGTIIRSALATNFASVFIVGGAKATSPKVIRASSGAVFKCLICELDAVQEFLQLVTKWELPLVAASMNGANLFESNLPNQFGLVLGNEGHGISKELLDACKNVISLPMLNGVESLNVGVAGSIIMYHKQFGGK